MTQTNPMQRDPTKTITLRRSFASSLNKVFSGLRRDVVNLIVVEDAFGLKEPVFNKQYEFSSTQVNVHDKSVVSEIKRLQREIDSTDIVKLEDTAHITVRYGLYDLDQTIEGVKALTQGTGRVDVLIRGLSIFEIDDADVLKFDIESEQLRLLNSRLKLLPNQENYAYSPHMTVAYVKKGEGKKYIRKIRIDGKRLTFDTLVYSSSSGEKAYIDLSSPEMYTANTRWKYTTQVEAVEQFDKWLKQQIQDKLLSSREATRWRQYIQRGFEKGTSRAFDQVDKKTKRNALDNIRGQGFIEGRREQFIRSTLNKTTSIEKLASLQQRTFSDVIGMTEDMRTKMKRTLIDGLTKGEQPSEIAARLSKVLKLSTSRGRAIAYTELVRAHADGQLNAMEQLGIESVGIAVEWDAMESACKLCKPMDNVVLTIAEAKGMIPRHPFCFTSHKVPIFTADGWKAIGDIREGDLVLTHTGKFKKVIQIHKRHSKLEEIIDIKTQFGVNFKLPSITASHPIVINGEWLEAVDAQVGDKIRCLVSRCQGCDDFIPYESKYCNQKCQWKNAEHKKNVADKNRASITEAYASGKRDRYNATKEANAKVKELCEKDEWCPNTTDMIGDNNPAKTSRARLINKLSKMGSRNPMRRSPLGVLNGMRLAAYIREHPEKHANYICAKKGHRTGIERKMEAALKSAGINAEFNHPELGKWIDFAILEHKIAIECDGIYWHQDKEKDAKRDKLLTEGGWIVLRFTDTEINFNVNLCVEKIQRVLKNHNGEYEFADFIIESVTKKKSKNVSLYNLSVEDDESYIAKGYIVHNCMCAFTPANIGEDSDERKTQKRSKTKIDRAIKKSQREEGSKEWGSNKPISKTRPKNPIFNVGCDCSQHMFDFESLLNKIEE